MSAISIPTSTAGAAAGAGQTAAKATAPVILMVDPAWASSFGMTGFTNLKLICRMNPKDLTISGGTDWKSPPANQSDSNVPRPQFMASKPRTLSVSLFFDQFMLPSGDVSKEIEVLFTWTEPREQLIGRRRSAPMLRLQWGHKNYFKCYIADLQVNYTHFAKHGSPLRAEVDLTLNEAPDEWPMTNPSSGGQGGERAHHVAAGDTLHSIAHQQYGAPRLWRGLAAVNGIDDPMRLPAGSTVALPELDVVEGLS